MSTTTNSKYEFHKKPYGLGNCPICDIPQIRNLGIHRAVREEEGIDAKWIRIEQRGASKKIVYLGRIHPRLRHARMPTLAEMEKEVAKNRPGGTAPASKYDFHRKPRGSGPCPYCGLHLKKNIGEHRAVREEEDIPAKWIRIENRGSKQVFVHVGFQGCRGPQVRKGGKVPGASAETIDRIRQIVPLYAEGLKYVEIGKILGMSVELIGYYRRSHPVVWKKELDKCFARLLPEIRAAAGTDAVMENPGLHLSKARMLDKWMKSKGKEMFPKGKDMSLSSFFEEIYLPQFLFESAEDTKSYYRTALRKWKYLTGDPPVTKVTNEMLAKFRDALKKISGRKGLPASSNTVLTHTKAIQHLLDKLGPAGQRNREALGILKQVPYARYVKREYHVPRTVGEEQIAACYEAAACMDQPWSPGLKPPAWWKAFLVLAWGTGLRPRSILSAEMKHVDWESCRLVLPASCMKSNRPLIMPLNDTVMEHLRGIRTDREMLFPWPSSNGAKHRRYAYDRFHRHFKKLQQIAGIDEEHYFTLKNVRKTLGSRLWESSPQAAQFALAHTSMDVTRQHYVDGGPLLARALEALHQPSIFKLSSTPPPNNFDLGAGI